jgi:hypothetical protein
MPDLMHLTLQTIHDLDPRVAAMVESHLATLARDCISRPTDKKPRRLTLQISAKPIPLVDPNDGRNVDCETVEIEIAAKITIPNHRSRDFRMNVTRGGFSFNPDSPDNPNQSTLFKQE